MRSYLLDTSIASILDPDRGMMTSEFEAWLIVREPRLFLSTITVFEVTQGIGRLLRSNKLDRARTLDIWFGGILDQFSDRVLPVGVEVARSAGELSAAAFAIGRHPGSADILIAATAQVHNLVLLTRNVRHFEPLGIDLVDPLDRLPG